MKRWMLWGAVALGIVLGAKLLPESLVASIGGLPGHPLFVHGAVVLLPLAAAGLAASLWLNRRSPLADALILAGATLGAAAAVISESSGKALAGIVGLPAEHAEWGERLSNASVLWLVATAAVLVLLRRDLSSTVRRSLAGAATLGTGVLIALVVLAGHSGATAVWGGRVPSAEAVQPELTETPAATASPSDSAEPTAQAGFTLADVAAHASASSCWTAIDGNVYDLTPFIQRHPGGANAIMQLCGIDGTAQFQAQHGGQGDPERELGRLKLGPLG